VSQGDWQTKVPSVGQQTETAHHSIAGRLPRRIHFGSSCFLLKFVSNIILISLKFSN